MVKDLAVGRNLQDHIAVGGLSFTLDQEVSIVLPRYENLQSALAYSMRNTGILSEYNFYSLFRGLILNTLLIVYSLYWVIE